MNVIKQSDLEKAKQGVINPMGGIDFGDLNSKLMAVNDE